jgi:carboxymethylenebutenolidase
VTATTRYETVNAHDGGTFEAFCAIPTSGSGPGMLLFQEIFGINDNMRGLAERLANEGYVTLVPDMFWRCSA